MDDLRERMEQLARRVDGAAAPDLQEVRQHRERRRTRSALVVGLCIALVGVFAASRVLRTEDPITPAAEGSLVVWPRDDGGAWQADPEQVVERFGQVVLGWTQPDTISYDPGVYEMRPEACPATARCTPSLTLTVEETSAGVWSVTSVTHPQLDIEVDLMDPRAALTPGAEIFYDLDLPADRSAHIGVVASNGCREATAFEVGLGSGHHELALPEATDDDPACSYLGSGYLFVYVTDDTTVPVGDPLREAAAIEYPWLTVIPIYLVMENEGETSTATAAPRSVLTITCGADGSTTIGSETVVAESDGVHVRVEGPTTPYRYRIDDVVTSVAQGRVDEVLGLAPGSYEATCAVEGTDPATTFDVVDPDGHWIDPFGSCEISGMADFEPVTVAEEDLATAASTHFGAAPGDAVAESAGYAASPVERFFIVYHGDPSPIGVVGFESHPQGMWTSSTLVTCRS